MAPIDAVPFDLWHQIGSRLDPQDYIHLSMVNRTLYNLLRSDLTARNSAQSHIPYSREAKLASAGQITYRQALGRAFDVREAVATAQPYSAALVAYGDTFLLNQGVLCYLHCGDLRLLDVHGASRVEKVVTLARIKTLLSRSAHFSHAYARVDEREMQFSLMHFSDGIVTCLCEAPTRRASCLIAIDVRLDDGPTTGKLLFARRLDSTRRLFVRHDGSYLYYGTHSVLASHGHHEWIIQGMEIRNNRKLTDRPVQLENFVGSEIGPTLCFEIHDGFFYAISNQTGFQDEEVDWTSYYVCLRFPLSDPKKIEWRRIWRRQHREGPINDTWTDISLRVDETTKQLLIVECRREWHLAGSENSRTYYTQPIDCFEKEPSPEESSLASLATSTSESGHDAESSQVSPHAGLPDSFPVSALPDDILTSTLDEFSKPNYEPPKKRLKRNYHAEYPLEEISSTPRRDYILSKTKYRTYNRPASAFIDVVNDPLSRNTSFGSPSDRLRLRIGSRKRKCPIDEEGEEGEKGLLYRPEYTNEDGKPMEWSDERFQTRGIKLWPPDDAPEELYSLLCPSKRCGKVEAASDERCLVYSTQPATPGGQRPIILISFDPSIGFPHLKRLNARLSPSQNENPVDLDRHDVAANKPRKRPFSVTVSDGPAGSPTQTALRQFEEAESPDAPKPGYDVSRYWIRTEPAMYLSINRGYWLR
ncbi:hypothetical protein AJ80_02852 [Polytolypa hystricis UAMH7299]|uniref:F-box domain-containing protein n=1 Tax=Polytolypa hystricis (strain UAMH7299) TaxID=1447883 RepID=A0A2B7YQB4_POLH7|nr:hypothetical protein AJ80_02852 [Polytolypa hystricis UAMH7299]